MKLRNKKTGKVGWLELYYDDDDNKMIAVLDEKSNYHPYETLSKFNEEWEDYKPTEPLIKDRKIRKVIKAWAELNIYSDVLYDKYEDCIYSPYGSDDMDTSVSISFDDVHVFDALKHRKSYTIAELCGEEEE